MENSLELLPWADAAIQWIDSALMVVFFASFLALLIAGIVLLAKILWEAFVDGL